MIIVAIAGSSASGKTTLSRRLCQSLGSPRAAILAVDSYYKDLSAFDATTIKDINFDHPDAFEPELLTRHLQSLRRGESIEVPLYEFSTYSRTGATLFSPPGQILILEGLYALFWPEIRALCDLRIFVDTPLDICMARRLERDQRERGRSAESVIFQWASAVEPMYRRHVAGTGEFASVKIDGSGNLDRALADIMASLPVDVAAAPQ